jgi:quinol monooxygenase YgiN
MRFCEEARPSARMGTTDPWAVRRHERRSRRPALAIVYAKLRVMAVIVIAEMFGISGRRAELATLLERFGSWAGGEPGCRRYIFAATLADPSRFVLVSEWETQEALDAHYSSEAFAEFQLGLDGLLARPSESTVHSAEGSVRPLDTRPMDPRDAD